VVSKHSMWLLVGTSMIATATSALAQDASPAVPTDATVAQSPADASPAAPGDTDIVVTGSRIIKNGDSSPSPVTVISTQDVLRVQPAGTLADALAALPVFAGSRGSFSNPSSTGSAAGGNGNANQLNLRNLGSNRTLILLDGMRIPPTTFNGIVDVDIIPQMLVQRVDVVTGGVSAVYGSDAVAGVVNYVIDRKFRGLSVKAETGIAQRGDGRRTDLGIAGGIDLFGGRGHVEASYEYLDNKGILARSDRSYLNQAGVAGAGTAANPYRLYDNVRQAGFPFGGLITNGVLAGQTFGSDGVLRPFVHGSATGTAALEVGGDGGYYDSSLVAPLEAHQIFGRFDYDLIDDVHFYAQVSGNLKTNESYSDYVKLTNVTISAQNAYLAPAYRAALAAAGQTSFRLSELVSGLPRLDSISKSDQWVYMGGLTGALGGFTWGANYTHGTTKLRTTLATNPNNQRLAAALDAVVDPATGNIVCNVTLTNPAAGQGCVPINVFGANAVSAAAAAYVLQPTHYVATTDMDDVSAHIEGSPFESWAGPVNVALSGDYRKLGFHSTSDGLPSATVNCTGIRFNCTAGAALWGFSFAGSPTVSQTVSEGAVEFDAPLVKDVAFIQSFSVNGAARYTHYDTSGNYWTWKLGFDWHVTDNLRLRGTRSRDIRAPTLYELFAPVNSVPVSPVDLLTGLSPSLPQTDLSNPDLKAEIGNTLTGGIVWKPIPRLSIALDGYHITIDDAVTQVAGSTPAYQQACYASGGTSPFCALQTRPNGFTDKSAANVVTRWYTQYFNIAQIETYGADLEVNYGTSLFGRAASFRFLGAWQPHVYYRQPGVPTTDQGGVAFGPLGLAAGPELRLTGFARFQPVEHLTLDLFERWRNGMKLGGDPTQIWYKNHIASFATTSATATVDFTTNGAKGEFFFNVSNLFDAHPPAGAYSGNGTRAGLRDGFALGDDPTGRSFAAGVRIRI
jgi:iron complex outermembrane receptor protein